MYSIHHYSEDVAQIVLPPCAPVPLPWGYPRSVYVLKGPVPALVDTGFRTSRGSLVAALAELDVRPERVGRILLTGTGPDRCGNLDLFERAVAARCAAPDSRDGRSAWAAERERIERAFSEALGEPDRPESWDESVLRDFFDLVDTPEPDDDDTLWVDDGSPVAAGNFVFDSFETSGLDTHGSAWYAADRRLLFSGDVLSTNPRPRIRDTGLLLVSIDRLHSLSIAAILPALGAIDHSPRTAFRAAHHFATNLRANVQYRLNEPRSAAGLAMDDLGYWPEDALRFTGRVLLFKQMLDELVGAGVLTTQQADGRTMYRLGAPGERAELSRP